MTRRYNLQKISSLLQEGFTEEELIRLCYDVPEFNSVYHRLNQQDNSKAKVIGQLIEYAETKSLVETLLAFAKEHNLAIYENYQPYDDLVSNPATSDDAQENLRSTETLSKRRVQIYLLDDFSSLSADRRAAAIDAFAAIMGILPQAIEVYRVYEGSIVFDLGIPPNVTQHLRSLLLSNDAKLRSLKVNKVRLERGSDEFEVWVAILNNLPKKNIGEYLYFVDDNVSKGAHFGIIVMEDSMKNDGILPGNIALIRQQAEIENGDIAAIVIYMLDMEPISVLKRYNVISPENQNIAHWLLEASNPSSEHLVVMPSGANSKAIRDMYKKVSGRKFEFYENAELSIAGKYVGLVRTN